MNKHSNIYKHSRKYRHRRSRLSRRHKHTKRVHTKRVHTKRVYAKQYTKSAKRTLRLKKKTRRIKRMHGGDVVGEIPQYTPPNPAADLTAANSAQNASNNLLKGGGYKKKGQKGGNENNLKLYAYAPPPGMMGPVPQPSQDSNANNLILQAAKINTAGQANQEFDKRV